MTACVSVAEEFVAQPNHRKRQSPTHPLVVGLPQGVANRVDSLLAKVGTRQDEPCRRKQCTRIYNHGAPLRAVPLSPASAASVRPTPRGRLLTHVDAVSPDNRLRGEAKE